MSRPGLFISFEGIDGARKSSHVEGLASAFRDQGRRATVTREPGGTPLPEKLRAGVLCVRFPDATFACQGPGRGFAHETLAILERMTNMGAAHEDGLLPEPDLTLWFALAPARAAERLAGAAHRPDRFEAQPVEFFRPVARGYADRAPAAPRRIVRSDAAQERHRVWQQRIDALVWKGWLW